MASRSSHLVDPSIRSILEQQPNSVLNAQTLPIIRQNMANAYNAKAVSDNEVLLETIQVPGPAGNIRVLSYRKVGSSDRLPAVLHIHAGGFVIGSPELAHRENRALVAEHDIALYSIEYRLAPETVYPGQLDDCHAVLHWLRANTDALDLDKARIGVKGESAGGCLAAALALRVRDLGETPLAFQILTFPTLDDRTGSVGDPHPFTGEYVWTATHNVFGWTSLLGRAPGDDNVPPYAAPARADDLAGLPPAYIAIGGLDLFLDENLDFAKRLSQAGVPVELHIYPGAVHGFEQYPGSWIAAQTYADLSHALGRFLQTTT